MSVSDELYAKLNTLPWQALFEYSKRKGIKEEDIKNKDKSQMIRELDNRQLIVNAEIDKLKNENEYLKTRNGDLTNKALKVEQYNSMLRKNLKASEDFIETLKEKLFQYEDIEIFISEYPVHSECDYNYGYDEMKEAKSEENNKVLISKLQDQHQQDCIRINDLITTVHVLSGLYSNLRKTVGMD